MNNGELMTEGEIQSEMTLLEAIGMRHSVRKYLHKPLSQDIIHALQAKIDECNRLGHLHMQLVTNETRAFTGLFAYGKFSGVENYIVIVGNKENTSTESTEVPLDERVGYYGEQLVLLAQQLGLNTCWAGLSYRKTDAYEVGPDEKLVCMIALGYGETQGVQHKMKTVEQVSNATTQTNPDGSNTPEWFLNGVKAALLAPTAINQQKFSFEYLPNTNKVKANKGFSMVGYTHMDLGIAKLHFEIGAGKDQSVWA